MSVVAGKVTFGSTGNKTVSIGVQPNDIMFFVDSVSQIGYADASPYQFSRSPSFATDRTKAVVAYDGSGTKVLEFNVTGFTVSGFTCNVTVASASYPFDLIART